MNSRMKTMLLVLSFVMPLSGSAAFTGGELGNGKYKKFSSDILSLEIQYPESWASLDLTTFVSFMGKAEQLVLTEESFASILDVTQLHSALSQLDSNKSWVETQIADRPAFEATTQRERLIYVLVAPGSVISMRTLANDKKSEIELNKVIRSLRFLDKRQD